MARSANKAPNQAKKQGKSTPPAEPETPEGRFRARVKRYLVQRFYTRFHMSLILMSAGFAAMLTNWALLRVSVGAMWLRYPIAISLSYLTFLAGVWLWIQYVEYRQIGNLDDRDAGNENGANEPVGAKSKAKGSGSSPLDLVSGGGGGGGGGGGSSIEMPNLLRGGGGAFDGGGAGGDWVDANAVQAFAGNPSPGVPNVQPSSGGFGDAFKGIGDKFGDFFDLDGDAIVLIVLALLLIASILILSGYIVWFAPDILSEAVFGATLAGGLARTAKRQDNEDWVMGVVKKTWWPFAIVFVASMAFAIYAAIHYPGARTFGEALAAAVAG